MRAREPDSEGYVDRVGVKLHWEVFGEGQPTLLLLPTWTIIHTRFWKAQVPYLARHFRVVTYDGPGNGRSDRPEVPRPYGYEAQGQAAAAVLANLERMLESDGPRTRDLGGTATAADVTAALVASFTSA